MDSKYDNDNRIATILFWLCCFLTALVGIAWLCSCGYSRKLHNAMPVTQADSIQFSKACQSLFPIDTLYKEGRLLIDTVHDSISTDAIIQYIDTSSAIDTASLKVEVLNNCPGTIIYKFRVDTINRVDSGLLFQYRAEMNQAQIAASTANTGLIAIQAKDKSYKWDLFYLWLVIAGLVAWILRTPILTFLKTLFSIIKIPV